MPNDSKKDCIKLYNIFLLFSLTIGIEYTELDLQNRKTGIPAIETDTKKIAVLIAREIARKIDPPYGPPLIQNFIGKVN